MIPGTNQKENSDLATAKEAAVLSADSESESKEGEPVTIGEFYQQLDKDD